MLKVEELRCRLETQTFCWSFDLPQTQMMAVVGPSGVGKSTLINALLGMQKAEAGSLSWHGETLISRSVSQRPFGVLFQSDNVFEHLSVFKNLSFGLEPSAKLNPQQIEQVEVAAKRFDIDSVLSKKASDLSGGQQQRVALARVFMQNKPILLLDEPFSSLDPARRKEGLYWVKELQKLQQSTVIIVTHHLDELIQDIDWVLSGESSMHWQQISAGEFS